MSVSRWLRVVGIRALGFRGSCSWVHYDIGVPQVAIGRLKNN